MNLHQLPRLFDSQESWRVFYLWQIFKSQSDYLAEDDVVNVNLGFLANFYLLVYFYSQDSKVIQEFYLLFHLQIVTSKNQASLSSYHMFINYHYDQLPLHLSSSYHYWLALQFHDGLWLGINFTMLEKRVSLSLSILQWLLDFSLSPLTILKLH